MLVIPAQVDRLAILGGHLVVCRVVNHLLIVQRFCEEKEPFAFAGVGVPIDQLDFKL